MSPSLEVHSAIRSMTMEQQGNGTLLTLMMAKPIALKAAPEGDGVFVIDGFKLNDWATNKQGSGDGDIRDYYVEDYSNGGGELVVRTDSGFKIVRANMLPKGDQYHYEVLLSAGDAPTAPSDGGGIIEVDKVQVGIKGHATRMVFHLSSSGNFSVSTNADGTETMLTPSRRVKWEAQTTMQHKTGLFAGYTLLDQGDSMALKIKTTPGTKVGKSFIQDAHSGNPKYVIDLVPDTISSVGDNGLFDASAPTGPGAFGIKGWDASPDDMPGPQGDAQKTSANDTGLIQSMDILTQSDDTIIKFVTKDAINLDVTENEYTNQIIVHLPKVNWMNVNALDKNGGLVNGYKVDQSSPDGTNLIVNVRKGTHVIGKKTVSGGNDQVHRFIIHLNQNEGKLPEWLVEATTQKLAYEDDYKEEIETTHMVYRGGVTPTASIGQGAYAGWNLNFFASEDKEEASNEDAGTSHKIFSGVNGGGFDGYIGFGAGLANDFYLGGELMLGHYLNKQTRTFRGTAGDDMEGSIKIGNTWGGSIRIGSYISPMALLYLRLGAVSTDFWFKGNKKSDGALVFPGDYSRRNRTGFHYGVGLDTAVNDYTSMRFELGQTTYQTFKYRTKNNAGQNNFVKHRFILNQFSLGMTHHFSPLSGPAASPIYEESVVRGLYGGVLFALNNMHSKRTFSNKTGGADINYYGSSSNSDPVWGFYVGYGRAKGRFYYAGEADISLSESITKESVNFAADHIETFQDSLKWRWGVVGRLGYILNHGVMAYTKFGLAAAKFRRASKNTLPAVNTDRKFAVDRRYHKHILGMRAGGGLEVTVNRVMGIRGDWTVDYYPKVELKGTKQTGTKEKQSIIDNRFGIGLTIYLSDALASVGLGTAV